MTADRTSGGFGATLREARERRGVSLRQIANATKISVAALEALERNHISRLPGGIFSRSFVRAYAIEVGLDPEKTIQEFLAQFPNDSVTAGHPVSDQVEDNQALESDRRMAGTFIWLILISVPIAGLVLYYATAGTRARQEEAPPVVVTAPPSETQPAVTPAAADPVATSPPEPVPSAATVAARAPARDASSSPPPAPQTTAAAAPASSQAPPESPGDHLTISLAVKRPCWVSATVDGQKAIERLLQPGEQKTIDVRREMVLTAGDASAITVTLQRRRGAAARESGGCSHRPLHPQPISKITCRGTVSVSTPLLDLFARRAMSIARCASRPRRDCPLEPRAHEQLAILVLLLEDPDVEVRTTADETLNQIPLPSLEAFLGRSDVPVDLREFFGDRGVFPAEIPQIELDIDEPLLDASEPEPDANEEESRETALQKLQKMTFTGRLEGGREGRAARDAR